VLAGTVGAGKSTTASILYRYFLSKSVKVHKTFLKSYHFLSYVIICFLAICLSKGRFNLNPFMVIREKRPALRKKLYGILLTLDFFEILILNLIRVLIPFKLGYIVIVEEHICGYLSDYLHYALVNPKFFHKYGSKIVTLYLRFISSWPMQVFFLDAPNSVLKERWALRSSHPEVESYLNAQRAAINMLVRTGIKVFFIRTDKSITETFKEIIRSLD